MVLFGCFRAMWRGNGQHVQATSTRCPLWHGRLAGAENALEAKPEPSSLFGTQAGHMRRELTALCWSSVALREKTASSKVQSCNWCSVRCYFHDVPSLFTEELGSMSAASRKERADNGTSGVEYASGRVRRASETSRPDSIRRSSRARPWCRPNWNSPKCRCDAVGTIFVLFP
jgi:hypothetical protein